MASSNITGVAHSGITAPEACQTRIFEYLHPEDVLNDPTIPVAEKRCILSSCLSDIRAVDHMPSYRQLDNGALVHLDDIYDALRRLDGGSQPPGWHCGLQAA